MVEEQRRRVEENMTKMVEEIDKSYLRKMQVHSVRRIVISGYTAAACFTYTVQLQNSIKADEANTISRSWYSISGRDAQVLCDLLRQRVLQHTESTPLHRELQWPFWTRPSSTFKGNLKEFRYGAGKLLNDELFITGEYFKYELLVFRIDCRGALWTATTR